MSGCSGSSLETRDLRLMREIPERSLGRFGHGAEGRVLQQARQCLRDGHHCSLEKLKWLPGPHDLSTLS